MCCQILIGLVCRYFLFAGILGKILFFSFGLLFLALFSELFAFLDEGLLLIACAVILFFLVGGL